MTLELNPHNVIRKYQLLRADQMRKDYLKDNSKAEFAKAKIVWYTDAKGERSIMKHT